MSNQKITQSEKQRLDNLQTEIDTKVLSYGRQKYIVEDLKNQLEKEKQAAKEIREEIDEAQNSYESYVQELYQKYGDVAIDLDSGDIFDPDEA